MEIDAIIDTGAETTLIGTRDAIRLGFMEEYLQDPKLWPNRDQAEGVGGNAPTFQQYLTIALRHVNGTIQSLPFPSTYDVLGWNDDGNECPTLLGWDILQRFEIFMNWPSQTIELRESGGTDPV